jgi:TRAP-type C4-dicarboxylate transport system permease small subunit
MSLETNKAPASTLPPPGWKGGVVRAAEGAERTIGFCSRGVLLVTGLALLTILNIIVVLRYTNMGKFDYGAELTSLIFPLFVMAGVVEAARQGAHIATQILLNLLNPAWRTGLVVLIHGVTAAAYFYLGWFAFQNAVIAHDEQSTILRVPGSLGYGALGAGLVLVAVCSIAVIVRHTLGSERVVVNLAETGPGVV